MIPDPSSNPTQKISSPEQEETTHPAEGSKNEVGLKSLGQAALKKNPPDSASLAGTGATAGDSNLAAASYQKISLASPTLSRAIPADSQKTPLTEAVRTACGFDQHAAREAYGRIENILVTVEGEQERLEILASVAKTAAVESIALHAVDHFLSELEAARRSDRLACYEKNYFKTIVKESKSEAVIQKLTNKFAEWFEADDHRPDLSLKERVMLFNVLHSRFRGCPTLEDVYMRRMYECVYRCVKVPPTNASERELMADAVGGIEMALVGLAKFGKTGTIANDSFALLLEFTQRGSRSRMGLCSATAQHGEVLPVAMKAIHEFDAMHAGGIEESERDGVVNLYRDILMGTKFREIAEIALKRVQKFGSPKRLYTMLLADVVLWASPGAKEVVAEYLANIWQTDDFANTPQFKWRGISFVISFSPTEEEAIAALDRLTQMIQSSRSASSIDMTSEESEGAFTALVLAARLCRYDSVSKQAIESLSHFFGKKVARQVESMRLGKTARERHLLLCLSLFIWSESLRD